ncbi:MAG TPA: CHAD domain-containing protein [Gammaproteobacteria bacterium]|nr:CHAD domain-containing protein [Gammaproteobacteria bacterium]
MSEPRAQRQVAPAHLPRSGELRSTATPDFGPNDPFIAFAHAVLRRQAAALAANKPRAEQAPTPDEIHQLRVAARRLRVALRLFGRMLPSTDVARFNAELRSFAGSLGDIRDLDVYTDNFKAYVQAVPPEQRGGLSGYEMYLRRERTEARQRAAAAVASPRAAVLLADIERFAAAGPAAGALRRWGSLSIGDAMRQSIRNSVGRVRRIGNQLTTRARPAELHGLRIKSKRLRYELEFFAEVYPPLKQTAKECKALQDLLGTLQDVYAGTARLRRYSALLRKQGGDGTLPPALVALRNNQLALARDVRRSFRATWPSFVAAIGAARKLVA